jgi:hypothetical protein
MDNSNVYRRTRTRQKTRRTVTTGWLVDQNWNKPAETIITKPRKRPKTRTGTSSISEELALETRQ